MFKAAIKSLLAHKTRLSLSVLAIVLGVAFIAGTYIYTDTSNAAFDGIFDEAFTGIDVVISGESDFSLGQGVFFEEELVNDVAAVPGVARVEPTVNGFGVQVLDREGEPIGGGGPPQLSDYLPTDLDRAGGFVLRDGRPPSGPDEMALDANTAELGEYAIGDSVTVVSQAGPAAEYELVGIVGFGDADNLGGATFALFDLPTAQAVIGQEGMITGAYAIAEDGTDTEALIMEVQTILPENAVAQSGQDAAAAEAADLQEALSFFGTFLLVFAFIALFVGTFLIYNTFQFVVAQRMRELALLRAIGATRSQVVRTVLLEAVLLGVIGSILGIVAGAGLAIGLRAALEAFGIALPSTSLVLDPRTVIVALVVGIVVTIGSALLPAIKASRVPPVAAMRAEATRPKRRSLTLRAIIGASVFLLGGLSLLGGLTGDIENTAAALGAVGSGAVLLIVGTYILSALVADPVARFLGAPVARLQGVPGTLAQRNAGRSPRRTSATAAAIMVGVALITLVSIMSASISDLIDSIFASDVDAQVIAQGSDQFSLIGFPPEFADRARELPEVDTASAIQVGVVLFEGTETFIGSLDDQADQIFAVSSLEGDDIVPGDGGITVPKRMAETNEWSLGTEIGLVFEQTGEQAFVIEAIAESAATDSMVINRNDYAANFAITADAQVYFRLAEGVSPEEGRDAIETVAAGFPTVNVQTVDETTEQIEDQIGQILTLITALLALTLVVSLVGVANTMLLSIYERTHEIGLLRAVGLDRRQTRRMIRSEATIIAVFGALLGVGLGVLFGWAVTYALRAEGFTSFVIPVGSLLIWIGIIAVLGILFAIYPAWRASRLNVLEAISYE